MNTHSIFHVLASWERCFLSFVLNLRAICVHQMFQCKNGILWYCNSIILLYIQRNLNNEIFFQADENLRLIRSSLPGAVEACIDAASHEFDISQQRALLRSASYGQAFCRSVVIILLQYVNIKCHLWWENWV